jgi:hypothetical protein
MELQSLLHTILLRSPVNLFDEFTEECQRWYEQPAHSFVEMRTRENKKIRGDLFEEFCVLYLKHVKKIQNVWRLADTPTDVLQTLGLGTKDMGIDLIGESNGNYYAVQCKYKKHTSIRKNILSWKALSTFYALCLRTGPWKQYIVMTNCEYTRHVGKKGPNDLSICLRKFRSITKEEWTAMCELEGNTVSTEPIQKLSPEELRAVRLARFSQTAYSTPHMS